MRLSGWAAVVGAAVSVGCATAAVAADAGTRPAITGLAYVRFYEGNMPAAQQFYGGYLGLKPTTQPDGSTSYAVGMVQRIELVQAADGSTPSRLQAVGFLTRDLPAMQRYLAAHGIKTERVSANEIRVHDPEGNLIAFVRESRDAEETAGKGGRGRATQMKPAGAAGAPTSSRMIHAGFQVHDRAKEDAFYKEVLGFRPYWYGGMKPGEVEWVSLQVPEGTDWIEYMLGGGAHPDARGLGVLDHASLGVDHIQDADKQLIANGLADPSKRKSQIGKDGKWQLNVFDPDLSRIEFMEFKPVQEPCCSPFTGKQPAQSDAE